MGKDDLTTLKADITTQLAFIKTIADKLENRADGLQADDIIRLESAGYQLQNLYSAVEDLLKLVAAHFENHIADASRWHSELLFRMTQPIPGIRPALLTQETYFLLNKLRSFRHFFRHAYSTPIEYAELQLNLDKARQLYPRLTQDIDLFLNQLGGEST